MKLILTLILLSFFCEALSQPIEIHRKLGGSYFKRDTVYLTQRQVSELLSVDSMASHEFKIAKNNYRISGGLSFVGVILLAMPVASLIIGGEPDWRLVGGGAVLLGGSIPFSKAFRRHAGRALNDYNTRHEGQGRSKVYFTGNGVTIKF